MSRTKKEKTKEKTKQMPDLDLTEHLNSTNFVSSNQKKFYESIIKNHISFGVGQAGVGKTFLSLWTALDLVMKGWYKKIYLVKPYVEAADTIGFLPGGINDKLDPFLMSFYMNLEQIIGSYHAKRLRTSGCIEVVPFSYLRGVTFKDVIVILDEAQNTTPHQMKLFLTRLGENSKFIVIGDIEQSDIEVESGLADAVKRFENVNGMGVVAFNNSDIVRHPLVAEIVRKYDD